MSVETQGIELGSEEGKSALLAAAARMKSERPGAAEVEEPEDKGAEVEAAEGADEKREVESKEEGEKKEEKEEKIAPGFAALKREQRRVYAEIDEKKKELESFREEIAEDVKAARAVAAAAETFLADPLPVAQALGAKTSADMHKLAKRFYVAYAKLEGKPIPREWEDDVRGDEHDVRLRREADERERGLRQLREEVKEDQRSALRAEYRAELKGAAVGVDEEEMPHVAALVEADPAGVADALLAIADDLVRQGATEVPEPSELLEIYEANLAKELAPFGKLYDRKRQKKGSKGTATKAPASRAPTTHITPTLSTQVKRGGPKEKRSPEERMQSAMSHLRNMVTPAAAEDDD